MGPVAKADSHDFPRAFDELVPRFAGERDDVFVAGEHPVREPVLADVLPDILDRVQFRRPGRQRHEGDVLRHDERLGHVPAGLVEDDHGVRTGLDHP